MHATVRVERGPAIALHALDPNPGCFDKPELESVEGVSEAQVQAAAARREVLSEQIDFAFEEADLLSSPLREEPEALTWSVEIEGGTLEGNALARGEGWSVIKMIAIYDAGQGRTSRDAIIDASPRRTLFDFGDREHSRRADR